MRRTAATLVLMLAVALLNFSCSGGLQGNSTGGTGSPGTPDGSYNVQISVSTTSLTHSTQVNLTVTQ